MKIVNKIALVALSVFAFSCTDEVENREAVASATTPVLKTPSSTAYVLDKTKETDYATTLVWDDARYEGTSTVVNYAIEVATYNTNFATPYTIATTTERFKSFTVGEINSALLDAGFAPFVTNQIDFRIKATVGSTGSLPVYSNVSTLNFELYPSWPNWGIIGDSTPTGWSSDTNMEYNTATKIHYLVIALEAKPTGGCCGIKFRLDDGWSTNFGDDGQNGTLEPGGSNIEVTTTGTYLVKANFSDETRDGMPAKTYTMTLQ